MGKRNRTTTQAPVPACPVPQNSAEITLGEKEYTAVTEGLATVLFPKVTAKKDKTGKEVEVEGHVFYNPIQQFNRDLSVLAIKAFAEVFLEEKRAKKEAKKEKGKIGLGENVGDAKLVEVKSEGQEEVRPEEVEVKLEATEIKSEEVEARTEDPMDMEPSAAPNTHTWRPQPPKLTILDALSATGLRALRYALEIPSATAITANDLDPSATASITHNIYYNSTHSSTPTASSAMSKIHVSLANASHHMYSTLSPPTPTHSPKYEVIDLDPFGSAAPFLDAAVQAITDTGLLCITCTDAGVWASTGYSEKCFSLYGGMPVKGEWSHEAGIRLILHAIATSAARYGCYIDPLLSLSIDFYARVFVRVRRGPEKVKRLAGTTMNVYNCDEGCGSWYTQRLGRIKEEKNRSGNGTYTKFLLSRAPTVNTNCAECNFPMHLAGPMWAGPLHSPEFITHLLASLPPTDNTIYATIPRITGMLQTALQESELDNAPFFFATTRLAKTLHCESPPLAAFRGALKGLGYKVARSHCKPTSIKTDAPWSVIWEVMRRWVVLKPVKEGGMGEKQAGYRVLRLGGGELTEEEKMLGELEIKFDEVLGRDEDKGTGVVRYQINPTANWGPMARKKEGVVVKGEEGEGVKEEETEREVKQEAEEEMFEDTPGAGKRGESAELEDHGPAEKKVKVEIGEEVISGG